MVASVVAAGGIWKTPKPSWGMVWPSLRVRAGTDSGGVGDWLMGWRLRPSGVTAGGGGGRSAGGSPAPPGGWRGRIPDGRAAPWARMTRWVDTVAPEDPDPDDGAGTRWLLGDLRRRPAGDSGEPRWPMALAVLATGLLRAALPPELRAGDSRWLYLVVITVLLGVLVIGDPGASTGTSGGSG